jgi:nucleoredoxin
MMQVIFFILAQSKQPIINIPSGIMSSAIVNLIGSELIDAKGQTIPAPQLPSDGALGIYFSAHWCPPCRMFTPQLADFYRKFKQTEAGSRLEIVFVSSDRDENAFKEYLADMPWLALPYSNRALKVWLGIV